MQDMATDENGSPVRIVICDRPECGKTDPMPLAEPWVVLTRPIGAGIVKQVNDYCGVACMTIDIMEEVFARMMAHLKENKA